MMLDILFKKYDYILSFNKESNHLWYVDIPWKWNHDNLQMVGGSDKLLQYLAGDREKVTVSCWLRNPHNPDYFRLDRKECGLFKGAFYTVENLQEFHRDIYLCPVTLWVLGKYPKHIWIKKIL